MKPKPTQSFLLKNLIKKLHQTNTIYSYAVSQEKAIQVKETIQSSILNLANHPYMGTTPKIRSLKDDDLRILILEKLIIIYTVVEKTKTIYLISIFDQRQDYVNILNGL